MVTGKHAALTDVMLEAGAVTVIVNVPHFDESCVEVAVTA
jgi:hypothetical protein